MWRIEDRVAVDVLDLNGNTPYWRRQAEVRFHNTSTVCYTMTRVRRSNW